MSYRKNMRKSGNSWQKRAEFLTVLIPIKQYGFFFEIYSKMVWQESERMLLEEPRHEDLNKRSVCPASHAGSCMNGKENFVPIRSVSERQEISEKYLEQSLLPSPEPNWSRALAAPKAAISLSRHRKNIRRERSCALSKDPLPLWPVWNRAIQSVPAPKNVLP